MTVWGKGLVLKEIGLNPMDFFDYNILMFDWFKFADWLELNFDCSNKSYSDVVKENFPAYYDRIRECFEV